MGIFGHRYSEPCPTCSKQPDPSNFTITDVAVIGSITIVCVTYAGCTNLEGKKILVYKDVTNLDLINMKRLDPHFSGGSKSPIARFAPTEEGKQFAIDFAKGLTND